MFLRLWSLTVACASAALASNSLEWRPIGNHRVAALEVVGGAAGFSLVSERESQVAFTNQLPASRSLTNQIYLNGSGVAAGDVDGDGLCDLYFCGLDNGNELYRNVGNWRFEAVTAKAGVACAGQASTGAALADIDGDGDLDLLVNAIKRGTRLFLNDGAGRFTEGTERFRVGAETGAMSMALADVNGDGFLDLYVVNYRSSTFRDEPDKRFRVISKEGRFELTAVDGRPVTEPDLAGRFTVDPVTGLLEHGEPDVLFLNAGGKYFERVSWTSGWFVDEHGKAASMPYDWGLSAMFRDVNHDGAPDLYVCNDFKSEDRFWLNDGSGKFRAIARPALRQTSLFSMGVDFADLDRDGQDEIFVADMLSREHARRQTQVLGLRPGANLEAAGEARPQYSRNTLFRNRGNGTYAEIAQLAGVHASDWSWCPAFLDVDLDGYEDLLITAGHERDAQNSDVARAIEQAKKTGKMAWRDLLEMRRRYSKIEAPLIAFRNKGDLSFEYRTVEWGLSRASVSQGMALADLDNDGDLDLAVNALNGPALLYRNNSSAPRVAVRLKGEGPNSRGVGAKIELFDGATPKQSQEMIGGGRYLSSDDFIRSFAMGKSSNVWVRARWRNGRETIVREVPPNTILELSESGSTAAPPVPAPDIVPVFRDVSKALSHSHEDQAFDDFQRQPLLPRSFSTLGPGVSWFDLDGDGWEELLVGSGRTGKIAVFTNVQGTLRAAEIPGLSARGTRDRTTLLGLRGGGASHLLIGSANYEDGLTNGPAMRQFRGQNRTMNDAFPGFASSTGPMAAADFDSDGDLDVFLGGRVIAARYPSPASSVIFRNTNGKWTLDEALSRSFAGVGLVSAALWSDLNEDGAPELVLAVDGGPIRIFSVTNAGVKERTEELGFSRWLGQWQSIAAGDFNSDGRMDLAAGNLGRNTKYQPYLPEAYHLYYLKTPGGSFTPIVEAYHDPALGKIVPMHDVDSLATVFPDLRQKYPTFAAFSTASVSDFLGERMKSFGDLRINTLDSMLFLNGGGRWEAKALPFEVQLSPVFGISAGDVDANGTADLFIAQNLFAVGQNTSRYDSGVGVLLLGDGKGSWEPVPATGSGIEIFGEGRGAAFCDFNHDGRLDLAVAQNGGETKLYVNDSPDAGLRVKLKGPMANPDGIGARVRARRTEGTMGPVHEIRAGEGYWSQAGGALVLGPRKLIEAVEIRWPGGARQEVRVPEDAKEVVVEFSAVPSHTNVTFP